MLRQLEKPCAVLSVRLPFATYEKLYQRSQERGTKLSAEARDLLNKAVQEAVKGDQKTQQEAQDDA